MSGFSAVFTSTFDRRAPLVAWGPDRRLRMIVRRALAVGLTAVLLLPAARGYSQWLGWLPLWLVGMPLAALWAMHGFRLPWPTQRVTVATRGRRRTGGAQARRRVRSAERTPLPKAA